MHGIITSPELCNSKHEQTCLMLSACLVLGTTISTAHQQLILGNVLTCSCLSKLHFTITSKFKNFDILLKYNRHLSGHVMEVPGSIPGRNSKRLDLCMYTIRRGSLL